jgi:hypothetical protein
MTNPPSSMMQDSRSDGVWLSALVPLDILVAPTRVI